ncbi:MAG: MoxR family ATPase, partial [Pseudomonadota bacterium]
QEILTLKAPGVEAQLSAQVVGFIQKLRQEDLFKRPGVAETLDWAQALVELNAVELQPVLVDDTLGALLKYQDDIEQIRGSEAGRLLAEVKNEMTAV